MGFFKTAERLLKKLFPQEEYFFRLIQNQVLALAPAKTLILEIIQTKIPDTSWVKRAQDIEGSCDKATAEIKRELHTTFITPFDREDLFSLADQLDDVADQFEAGIIRLTKYRLVLDEDLLRILESLGEGIVLLGEAIPLLAAADKNRSALDQLREKMRFFENRSDDIIEKMEEELNPDKIANSQELIRVLQKIRTAEALEQAVDHCRKIFTVIDNILVKYA